jgi:hypothetical protein
VRQGGRFGWGAVEGKPAEGEVGRHARIECPRLLLAVAFRLRPVPGAGECRRSRGRRGGARTGLACTLATVERRLRKIRKLWEDEDTGRGEWPA